MKILICLFFLINLNNLINSNEINEEKLLQDYKPNKIGGKRGKRGKYNPNLDTNNNNKEDIDDFVKRSKGKMRKFHNNNNNKGINSHPKIIPVLGEIAINGTKPMIGSHSGRDGIFALACNYPLELFKFFVGSVRRFGYTDDIVLAVNPKRLMPPSTYEYLVETNVVGYAFEVDCRKKDDCQLKDSFYG